MADDNKNSADLQREIEAHRHQMEERIDEIQARLSPGQLIDEVLSYGKGGGTAFVSSLSETVSRNPLPVALLGVSLAWLIAGPRAVGGPASSNGRSDSYDRMASDEVGTPAYSTYGAYHDLPYAKVSGPMQRLGHITDDAGKRHSEFVDDAGKKFRAPSDEAGHRAGHFVDEAGKTFRGFIDDAGNRIEQFQDEAGNIIDDAAGWASHSFRMAGEMMDDARRHIGEQTSSIGQQARHLGSQAGHAAMQAGGDLQHQTDRMVRDVGKLLQEQPLISGALAFALGAALGAALPRTEQEDKLVGERADKLKSTLSHEASKLYDESKEQLEGAYDDARREAGEIYTEAKDTAAGLFDRGQQSDTESR